MNGSTTGITVVGSLLTADYSTTYGALQPGRTITLRFRAVLDANLAIGTRVTNTGTVYWNDPAQTASASVSIDVGGIAGVGIVNGRVVARRRLRRRVRRARNALEGWTVELYRNDALAHVGDGRIARRHLSHERHRSRTTQTPDRYELRFAGPARARRRRCSVARDSEFTNDLQRITDIVVLSGSNLQNLNLPIDPNGVVYDAMSRAPIAGATVTLAARRAAALRCRRAASTIRTSRARSRWRRLLQVRSELRRSRVPERRQLSPRK